MKHLFTAIILIFTPSILWAGLSSILEPVTLADVPTLNRETDEKPEAMAPEKMVVAAEVEQFVKSIQEKKPVIKVQGNDVLNVLAALIHDHYELVGELRVRLGRTWNPVEVNSSDWDMRILELPVRGLSSSSLVQFEIIEGNITVGQWQLPIRCELWRDVLMGTRRNGKGQELLAKDFSIKRVDILRLKGDAVPTDINFDDYELAQTVSSGSPLLWNQITRRPLIRKGDMVEVVAAEGSLRITMKGLALESGVENEFISVRNLSSKKSIDAQVIDEKHVQVYF